jgi:cardiolipin synthase
MFHASIIDKQKFKSSNKVQLVRGGKAYFDLLISLIENALYTIHLQTYIFEMDATGIMVSEALKNAAQRKVAVYLLVDGYASQSIPKYEIEAMTSIGIHFRFFEPVFKSKNFYFGRRMHQKIFIADSMYAIVGGINIANKYNDQLKVAAWLDFALYVEGEIAQDLCFIAWKTWNGFSMKSNIHFPCIKDKSKIKFTNHESCDVRIRRNDWVRRKNEISATYFQMFQNANSHITIICSYFLPGKIVRGLLSNASKRGVIIKVITAGTSDIMIAKHAERWLYDWLLRNNIELYEYQPSILHAKVAVCDSEWLTIGSYNLNNMSAYASIELNLDVRNKVFALQLEDQLKLIQDKDCIAITKKRHTQTTNILIQFIRWCCYEILRVIFFLLTFYYKQKKG